MSIEAIQWIVTVVIGCLTTILGWVMWNVRSLSGRMDATLSRDEIRELIEDKNAVLYIQHREMKEDIKETKEYVRRIEEKLDQLLRK